MGQRFRGAASRCVAVVAAPLVVLGVLAAVAPAASAAPPMPGTAARTTAPTGLAAAPAGLQAAIRNTLGTSAAGYAQQAELTASDKAPSDDFGASVALSALGTTALVGAIGHNSSGAAYVFTLRGGTWSQTAELTASDGAPGDDFGASVALSALGTTALVGAPEHNTDTGAAYVFTLRGGTWSQTAELTASDGAQGDFFGRSVALSALGTTALAGAPGHNFFTGAAYVFTLRGGTWSQTAELTDGVPDDAFGWSVALSALGTTALAGAPAHNTDTGAAYVFTLRGDTWSQTAELTASDGAPGDDFGWSVALSALGTTALVGAVGHNSSGAAYVFTLGGGTWSQTAELTASDGAPGDDFGYSVALSALGTTALVGAHRHNSVTGAAYVFTLGRGTWSQTAELTASDGAPGDHFGYSVALSALGITALAGAPGHNSVTGAAYVFTAGG
jgi:nucleoside-specific outer membrane channel protein Tsx